MQQIIIFMSALKMHLMELMMKFGLEATLLVWYWIEVVGVVVLCPGKEEV